MIANILFGTFDDESHVSLDLELKISPSKKRFQYVFIKFGTHIWYSLVMFVWVIHVSLLIVVFQQIVC